MLECRCWFERVTNCQCDLQLAKLVRIARFPLEGSKLAVALIEHACLVPSRIWVEFLGVGGATWRAISIKWDSAAPEEASAICQRQLFATLPVPIGEPLGERLH